MGIVVVRAHRGRDCAPEAEDRRWLLVRELGVDENPPVENPRMSLGPVGHRHGAFAARCDGLFVPARRGAAAGGLHAGDDQQLAARIPPPEGVDRRNVVLADMPGVDQRAFETHRFSSSRGRGRVGQTVEFGARDDADLGAERRGGESRPQRSAAEKHACYRRCFAHRCGFRASRCRSRPCAP